MDFTYNLCQWITAKNILAKWLGIIPFEKFYYDYNGMYGWEVSNSCDSLFTYFIINLVFADD